MTAIGAIPPTGLRQVQGKNGNSGFDGSAPFVAIQVDSAKVSSWGIIMNKFALLCTAFAFSVAASASQSAATPDHLIPMSSDYPRGWSDRDTASAVRFFTVFGDGYGNDIEARAMVFPAFSNEYLIAIRATRDDWGTITGYHVVYLMPEIPLHAYESLRGAEGGLAGMDPNNPQDAQAYKKQTAYIAELKASLPSDPKDIPVTRCERPLENRVAETVVKAWQDVLLETHYDPKGSTGLDGVTYDFHARGQYQSLAGWAWSPDEDSKPGMLVALVQYLRDYCEGKAAVAELQQRANVLAKRLERKP